jgi:hypothetical protein
VEGALDDVQALTVALSAAAAAAGGGGGGSFPPVSTVVSFLGAYISLKAIFTRDRSHPIADAFQQAILPTMKAGNVRRILVLSTPTAFCSASEAKSMPWKWWLYTRIPLLFAPQGNAEMKGIAEAVVEAGGGVEDDQQRWSLLWTVFRVPHLTDGDADAKVIAGHLDQHVGSSSNTTVFAGTTELGRGSLARWVLREIEEKNWLRQAPLLGNA